MAYEMPQQLEYQEKIMFGLTFKQLFYAFIFSPLIAFTFFKTNWHVIIKLVVSANFVALAVGFIFLNLDYHLKNWYYWYKSKRIEKPEKLQKFIPIKEITDQLIITNDDRKMAVLKINPLNFSIKHDDSKDAIAKGFQKFLNSLDFPVQILMSTENLDLKEYFKEVESRISKADKFKKLFKEYKEHLEDITKNNKVMNRNFYLIIPEKTDISIQLQICQSKLGNLGLKSFRLQNTELRNLIKNYFEGKEGFSPQRIENYSTHLKIIKNEETRNN